MAALVVEWMVMQDTTVGVSDESLCADFRRKRKSMRKKEKKSERIRKRRRIRESKSMKERESNREKGIRE